MKTYVRVYLSVGKEKINIYFILDQMVLKINMQFIYIAVGWTRRKKNKQNIYLYGKQWNDFGIFLLVFFSLSSGCGCENFEPHGVEKYTHILVITLE